MRESKKNNTARCAPPVIDDERFKNALTDPIFRRVPKKEKKVDIDNRFKSMFHDKKFKLKYNVDKRGRPIDLSTNEDLRQYYNLVEDDDEKQAATKKNASVPTITRQPADGASGTESESDSRDEDNEIEGNILESDIKKRDKSIKLSKTMKKKLHDTTLDFARGDGILVEDSSDDSESSEDELVDGEDTVHEWGELDKDAERTEESTNRLALCNADWDRLKAVDLMVLFHSFLPPGGALRSINIYTSEYGKERLAYEDVHGPTELKKGSDSESEVSEDEEDGDQPKTLLNNTGDDEEGDAYHMEKLRKYQLNRLKYFYAVLEFDSVATAEKVYAECDGIEYESSATRLDLRFIPDNMTFEDPPTDSCDSLPLAEKYRPRFFTTTALQQAKVTLTWDETDPLRRELTQKVHNPKEKIDDEDLRAYLASSDSEAESDNDGDGTEPGIGNTIDKYRALLESIETKEKKEVKDVEMEITWGVGLKEKTESLVQKKLEEQAAATLTPWEEILAKKKEKRKLKKVQPKLQTKVSGSDDDDTSEQEEGLSDDDVDVDMNDPFFRDEIVSNEIMKASTQRKRNKEAKIKTPRFNNDDNDAALELLLMDDIDNKKHFNFKRIVETEVESKAKKKRKNRKAKKTGRDDNKTVEDSFEVDVADNRFSALFSSHHYNVDPSDPSFKKTKGMEAIVQEKHKRRSALADAEVTEKKTTEAEDPPNPKIRKGELAYLVKSVKRNTEMLKRKGSKRK